MNEKQLLMCNLLGGMNAFIESYTEPTNSFRKLWQALLYTNGELTEETLIEISENEFMWTNFTLLFSRTVAENITIHTEDFTE